MARGFPVGTLFVIECKLEPCLRWAISNLGSRNEMYSTHSVKGPLRMGVLDALPLLRESTLVVVNTLVLS